MIFTTYQGLFYKKGNLFVRRRDRVGGIILAQDLLGKQCC